MSANGRIRWLTVLISKGKGLEPHKKRGFVQVANSHIPNVVTEGSRVCD